MTLTRTCLDIPTSTSGQNHAEEVHLLHDRMEPGQRPRTKDQYESVEIELDGILLLSTAGEDGISEYSRETQVGCHP